MYVFTVLLLSWYLLFLSWLVFVFFCLVFFSCLIGLSSLIISQTLTLSLTEPISYPYLTHHLIVCHHLVSYCLVFVVWRLVLSSCLVLSYVIFPCYNFNFYQTFPPPHAPPYPPPLSPTGRQCPRKAPPQNRQVCLLYSCACLEELRYVITCLLLAWYLVFLSELVFDASSIVF